MTKLTGILHCERFDTSRNGNPRYTCWISDTLFYTGVDSMLGYSISNYKGKKVEAEVKTNRGKLTLQSIKGA